MAYKYTTGSVNKGDIYAEDDSDTYIDFSPNAIGLVAGGSNTVVISGSNVGIGTPSPATKLHVKGDVKVANDDARVKIDGAPNSHPGLELYENGTRKWIIYNNYTTDDLTFKTDSNERMVIEQGGSVGIGTSSPTSTLGVSGSVALKVTSTGTGITLDDSHFLVQCTGTGIMTIALPAVAGCGGRIYYISNSTDNNSNITIDPNSSETVGGESTKTLQNSGEGLMIMSTGNEWLVLVDNSHGGE